MDIPKQESFDTQSEAPRLNQLRLATFDQNKAEKQKVQKQNGNATASDKEKLEQQLQEDEVKGLGERHAAMKREAENKEFKGRVHHQEGAKVNKENASPHGSNYEKVKAYLRFLALPLLIYISICLYRDLRDMLSGGDKIFKINIYETDQILYVIMAGAVFKLWDDLKDGGFMKQGVFCSSLLMVLCFLCAYSCYQDFLFSVGVFLTELSVFIFSPKSYQGTAEKSCLYALPFLVLLSLPYAMMPTVFDIGAFLTHYLPILFTQKKYEEQYSMDKLKNRVYSLAIAISFITLFINYPLISVGVFKMMMMSVGYYGVSVAFQVYYQLRERKYLIEREEKQTKK